MDLELEPAPPEPPPAPRPELRRHSVAIRRARIVATVRAIRGRVPAIVRGTLWSLAAHAAVLVALAILWAMAPDPAPPQPDSFRIVLRPFVEARDAEAEAGGRDARAESPSGGTEGAAGETAGRLFDDEVVTDAAGVGAAATGSAFVGRTGGKEKLLEAGGGDAATEGALRLALGWLARHQEADGTWNASAFDARCKRGGPRCEGLGEHEYTDATTALVLLPYLGAGHTWREGPWKDAVRRGVRALVERQHADGSFATDGKRGYACTLATLALAEGYGLTQNERLREPAQRAVTYLVRTQTPSGGWRYAPGDGEHDGGATDSSVTGWGAIALCSARRAGLDVPDTALAACRAWFANVRSADGDVGYVGRGGGSAGLLGVGAFASVLLGTPADAPQLERTFERLRDRLPRPPKSDRDNAGEYGVADPVHWYYGALAAFQRGGETWDLWRPQLRETVLRTQVRDTSDADGSWPAMGATGRHGGRLVSTAFCALTLEVYYRYPRATLR